MTTTTDRTASTAHTDGRAEAPLTLDQPAPRALRLVDQLGLWGNLGVSLLGFTGAIFVLYPGATALSLAAALTAVVVGTLLGTAGLAAAAVPGARTGAPAMVLLRGLFGTRASYLPTALNIVQLIGWTTFELVVIGAALHQMTDSVPKWVYVLAAGVITTFLALRPLGWIRVLRKYVTLVVLVALTYYFVQILRHPLPGWNDGSWHDFWIAVDTVIGVSVSWVPLASDYSRHAHSARDAAAGAFFGYSATQIACYALGLFTLVTVAHGHETQIFSAFLAVPVGGLAFAILAIRELDQSFADTYSTAVSVQNLRPKWDRRALALVIGTLATVGALALNIQDYENFLLLIGSVFVPLFGVFVVDYFLVAGGRWDISEAAPARWVMVVPWLLGFVAYQLVNPGYIGWWSRMWGRIDGWLHFAPPNWMSASIISFLVAAVLAVPLGVLSRRRETRC
jgi:putative hydroxymethylpyrimidine transporter CytX